MRALRGKGAVTEMGAEARCGEWRLDEDALLVVREMEIFCSLGSEDLRQLSLEARFRGYGSRQAILDLEDKGFSYFVVNGSIRTFRLSVEGQELTMCELGPGSVVGPLLAHPEPQPRTLLEVGATGAELCRVPHRLLAELQGVYPHIGDSMARLLWGRVEEAYEQMESLAYEPVITRVGRALLRRLERNGVQEIKVTREEIATEVGSRREEVSRAMSKLLRERVVECPSRGQVVVRDPARLLIEEAHKT